MSGPYDLTWAQWGWSVGACVVAGAIALVLRWWLDRRRR